MYLALLKGRVYGITLCVAVCAALGLSGQVRDRPFLDTELVFPLEHWHNHASMVVELPGGDLFVCWFHGSGERTADDVVIRGARLRSGSRTWSEPFLLADTPGYPDTNATIFLDPKKRLWLMWPTILANEWHTALMKYKIASDYRGDGPPRWDVTEVMHVTPGDEFAATVNREVDRLLAAQPVDDRNDRLKVNAYAEQIKTKAADKLYQKARVDDEGASVRARWQPVDRAAVLRWLQFFADGDFGRLGGDVEDQHPDRRPRQHSALAGQEEGWDPDRVHAGQRPRPQAAHGQSIGGPGRDVERRRRLGPAEPRVGCRGAGARERQLGPDLQRPRTRPVPSGGLTLGRRGTDVALDPPSGTGPRFCRRAAYAASITTRRSSRPRTARCTRPTASSHQLPPSRRTARTVSLAKPSSMRTSTSCGFGAVRERRGLDSSSAQWSRHALFASSSRSTRPASSRSSGRGCCG